MDIQKYITSYNHYNGRNGQSIQYIVIHYVGALGGAKDNCIYYAGGDRGASAHYYVGFSGEIWQSVEDANGAWSVGGGVQGPGHSVYGLCTNYNSLNIEMCVRKKSTATMLATDKDWYFEDATVSSAIELTKYLMKKYNVPAERVVRHYDVVGKICPNPYVYNNTKHTWTAFKAALGEESSGGSSAVSYYRVGTAWSSGKCVNQHGAFTVLSNAKTDADAAAKSNKKNYYVFDEAGKSVYTAKYTAESGTSGGFASYTVKVEISNLYIRKGPGTSYAANGFCPAGIYTIVEEKKADNFTWGRLKSGAGWIALEYTKKA